VLDYNGNESLAYLVMVATFTTILLYFVGLKSWNGPFVGVFGPFIVYFGPLAGDLGPLTIYFGPLGGNTLQSSIQTFNIFKNDIYYVNLLVM